MASYIIIKRKKLPNSTPKTKSQRNKPYLLTNYSDSNIKNQTIEQQESILSQRTQTSSSTFIQTIINPHTLDEKEMINNNDVTS